MRNNLDPVDLTVEFAEEITKNNDGNIWSWVTDLENAYKIVPHDWIPITITNNNEPYTFNMEVARVQKKQEYYGGFYMETPWGGTADGYMCISSYIDFISKELVPWFVDYKSGGECAISTDPNQMSPWLAGDLHKYLNDTLFYMLPKELQEVIKEKYSFVELNYKRVRKSDPHSVHKEEWVSLGNLWLPDEKEGFGDIVIADPQYSNRSVQYEVLNTKEKRVKALCGKPDHGVYWYTLSPDTHNHNTVVTVNQDGERCSYSCVKDSWYRLFYPICFRVKLESRIPCIL